ncbi:hypothetical protein ZIOFF_065895 [Zingiber officinale]|uniref:Uncharacterized protein n=1 Tax=Zingiber officinale TaxID=94328 RepID=A0A8J5EY06_ZINOF|nr:hypothetical protein ZIOFF_065895 [Zingiber officinale]
MTVSQNTIRNVIGVIGNIISFGLFLSPMPTFVKIFKKKAVEDFSPIPYLATTLNCMFWIFYGLPFVHPNSILVSTINGIGLAFEVFYLSIFFAYASRQGRVAMVLIVEIVFTAVVATLVLHFAHTHEKRSFIVGILCIIFGICMYVSPLSVMIPNGMGALFAFAQLVLYGCYYKSTPKKGSKAEVEMPTVSP